MRPRLKPVLAPLQVASLALGCVIGFGCFILAGDFLETAGPLGAALGITLGGLAMLVIARSYGLMVRTFPVAGAEFAYAYRAAGRHHAVICGWFLTLGYLSIVPLNATALAILGKFLAPELFARGYLYRVAGFEVFAGEVGLAAFAVVVVGFLQSRGVRGVGRAQVVMTGLMVAAVAAVGIGGPGASLANWEPWFAPGRPAWSGVLAMLPDGSSILVDLQRKEFRDGAVFVASTSDGVVARRAAKFSDGRQLVSDDGQSAPVRWQGSDVIGEVRWMGKTL